MADKVSFGLVDASGAPLTGAEPEFVQYRDLAGASRSPPAITELGGGQYGFSPTDADEAARVAYLVDAGVASDPRRFAGAIHAPAAPFIAWHLEDSAQALWGGAAPTVGVWKDFAGADRAPPTVLTPGGTAYLFAAVPSSADLAVDVAFRIDSPANALPEFLTGSLEQPIGLAVAASPGVQPDQLVIDALLLYLRRLLPAKCAQLNALRFAKLKSALREPFTIPAGAVMRLSAASEEAAPTEVPLTPGVVSAAQLVEDFDDAGVPGMSAEDEDGHFTLISGTAPSEAGPSVVIVAQDTDGEVSPEPTGANIALGWGEGGEHFETRALVSPSWRGVVDGRALTAPDMGQGFWVMLGNRTARPTHPGVRRNTFLVTVACEIWRPFSSHAPPHRTREPISSCVRAVRELLLTTEGRYLGRVNVTGGSDTHLADVAEATIPGDPLQLTEVPGVMFDVAKFTITCRVFQRPE